ncbi:MAG: methylated-DNA--[Pyramidobacter sp.]|nr:methylated-DNA--[protein]-cysteine S-methyltransferase [Pyramidobacter sp.]
YFTGGGPDPSELPLTLSGTPFQNRVWSELINIPYGRVETYGAIAARLGSSARAVGGAVGRNPISIVVPCHRVLGSSGSLTGYAGGLENKIRLLRLEGVPFRR